MAEPEQVEVYAKRSYVKGERPRWSWDRNTGGFTCEDTWLVPWENLVTFVQIAGGTVENVGGTLLRVVPLKNKDWPGALLTRMSGQDDGWDIARNDRDYCRVRCEYEVPKYGLGGDDAYLTFSIGGGQRQMTLEPGAITAGTGSFGLPRVEPVDTTVYRVTSHNLAALSADTYSPYKGYINDADWRGFPQYTVKFADVTSNESRAPNNTPQYTLEFVFEHCRIPWNQEYNSAGTLTTTTWNGGLKPPSTGFSSLFGW
jgi:hypothetical protein